MFLILANNAVLLLVALVAWWLRLHLVSSLADWRRVAAQEDQK